MVAVLSKYTPENWRMKLKPKNGSLVPGNSAGDLFGMVKWPPTIRDKEVTLNHLVDVFVLQGQHTKDTRADTCNGNVFRPYSPPLEKEKSVCPEASSTRWASSWTLVQYRIPWASAVWAMLTPRCRYSWSACNPSAAWPADPLVTTFMWSPNAPQIASLLSRMRRQGLQWCWRSGTSCTLPVC